MLGCTCSLWLLFLLYRPTHAGLSNRTIDDEQGDAATGLQPVYSGSWNYGPDCPGCFVQPDASRCFDSSWHDTTIDPPAAPSTFPYVNLTFNGTAVYVFAVVPNTVEYATTMTNVTFTMNDNLVGTYLHNPNSSAVYEYNVPIYVNESMPNDQYTLQVEPQAGTQGSYLAFDYAIYTFDDTPTTSSGTSTSTQPNHSSQTSTPASSTASASATSESQKSSSTGPIVGGVVGGLAAIAAISLVIFWLRRRKRGNADAIQHVRRDGGSDIDMIENAKIEPFPREMSQDAFATQPLLAQAPSSDDLQRNWRSPGPSIHPGGESSLGPAAGTTAPSSTAESSSVAGARRWDDSIASLGSSALISASAAPTAAGIGGALATAQRPSRARSQKAAQRQQELARQVREMEQTVASLNAQRAEGWTPEPARSDAAQATDRNAAEEALRLQVDALQLEVERLRAEQEEQRLLAMEPPPAYEHPLDDVPHHGVVEHGTADESQS